MRRRRLVILLALISATLPLTAWGLDKYVTPKVWGKERLTFADLNALAAAVKSFINDDLLQGGNALTIPDGDSLMVNGRAVVDSMRVNVITGSVQFDNDATFGGTTTLDTLTVTGPTTLDSLNVAGPTTLDTLTASGPTTLDTLTVTGPTTLDTLTVGGPAAFNADVTFDGSVITIARKFTGTAGSDLDFTHGRIDSLAVDSLTALPGSDIDFSHARIDSLAVDSLTALGPSFFGGDIEFAGSVATLARKFTGTAGSDMDVTHLRADTLAVDSLTVVGKANITGTAGDAIDVPHVRADTLAVDSLTITGLATIVGDLAATGTTALDTLTVTGPTSIPVDSSTLSLPSELLSAESAHKVIRFDLTDQAQMWNLAEFRRRSESTSWYGELQSHFPTRGLIWITTGQDSVVIWDTDKNEEWMVFTVPAGAVHNLIGYQSDTINGIAFKDGCLYAAGSTSLRVADFVADNGWLYNTSGKYIYKSTISDRDAGSGVLLLNASPAIVNAAVNAVSVIRDPEGSTDSFGRPQHIVAVFTDAETSLSNAGITAFYDNTEGTHDADAGIMLSAGDIIKVRDVDGSIFGIDWTYRVQSISADGWTNDESWYNGGAGSEDLPGAPVLSSIIAVSGGSVVNAVSPLVVFGSDLGLYISHAKRDDNTNGLTYMINDVRNVGPWSSTVVDNWSLTDTIGAYGKDLTRSGAGVTFSDSGAVFDGTDYMQRVTDSGFNLGTADFAISFWFKSDDATNASEWLWDLHGSPDRLWMALTANGYLQARLTDDWGATDDPVTFSQDVMDGKWHFGAVQRSGSTLELYCDSEQVNTDPIDAAAGSIDPDTLKIGAAYNGTSQFTGTLWQFNAIKGRALAAKEIRHEYQRGMAMLDRMRNGVSQTFTKAIVALGVDERSGLVAAASAGSLAVIDPNLMVILEKRASTVGTLKDVAITTYAGSDSISIVQGGSTGVDLSQPDPLVAEAAGSGPSQTLWSPTIYNPIMLGPSAATPTGWAVVDSAGHGHFTQVDQAIDAGYTNIYITKGTYEEFTADVDNLAIRGSGRNTVITDGAVTAIAISVTADDILITNLAAKTLPGGAGGNVAAINVSNASTGCVFDKVWVLSSDTVGFNIDGPLTRIVNCDIDDCDTYGVNVADEGDGLSLLDSKISDSGTGSYLIDAAGEDCIVDGMKTDGAGTDNSATSTVGDEESTAFND